MVKGKRQRANKVNSKKVTDKTKKPPSCNVPNMMKEYPVRVLNNSDVAAFKALVELSNNVAGLMKQCVDTDLNIAKGNETVNGMLKGKIKGPAMKRVTQNLYLPITDIHGLAKQIKSEVDMLGKANIITRGQLLQRYDEYVDTLRNVKRAFEELLALAPKKELKMIRGNRIEKSEKDAQIIFEKEVDKLTSKDVDFLKATKKDIDKKTKKK